MSYYSRDFANKYDAQEPIAEEEIEDEDCPDCGEASLIRTTWRRVGTYVECSRGCNYYRDEDPIEEDVR